MPGQLTDKLMLVRPKKFGFNSETAASNPFQQDDLAVSKDEISRQALSEFEEVARKLRESGVTILQVDDTPEPPKPDAVFPNNWISTHSSGTIVTYPMFSHFRRQEIRSDIVELLKKQFVVDAVLELQSFAEQARFLEGTGSLVLDRVNRIAYACLSPRTDEQPLRQFCERMEFQSHVFSAADENGVPFYHTNVMMSLTERLAIACLESIRSQAERELLVSRLHEGGREIVEITQHQVGEFVGNLLQVKSHADRRLLLMSQRARESLNDQQLETMMAESEIIDFAIPTIEKYGGGSIRCMLAELFLQPR